MMADYMVLTGGGWPDPETPWPLFLAVVARGAKYEARERLRLTDSVSLAIAMQFGKDPALDEARGRLEREAYPTKGSAFMPNAFEGGAE